MRGVYLLVINVKKDIKIMVGSLGDIEFRRGTYLYVGSAQNGLENRIVRHLSNKKKIFWHVDYLLNNKSVEISNIFYKPAKKEEECRIAKKLIKTEDPVMGFGCSDCDCKSHLFKVKDLNNILTPDLKKFNKLNS